MEILNSEERFVLKLFNLEDGDVQSMTYSNINADDAYINITLKSVPITCPECNFNSPKIKGYVTKKIQHSALSDRSCKIIYHARRYVCPVCHRTFYEHNPFVFKSMKISALTVINVLNDLKDFNETFTSVARRYHISPTSCASIFDNHVRIPRKPLPEAINFDEVYAFRSKGSKYVCVLLDYHSQAPIDLLPSRHKNKLIDYFYNIPKEERLKVKYVCFDMWEPYRDVARIMFPNSTPIVDRFHMMQDLNRRFDKVRIRIMKGFNTKSDEYYVMKKFNFLLFKSDISLMDPNREKQYNHHFKRYMNYYDISVRLREVHPDILTAWNLKDAFVDFYEKNNFESADEALTKLIIRFEDSGIEEISNFAIVLRKWKKEIVNSFIIVSHSYKIDKDTGIVLSKENRMNNGIIENRNKVIKCIKHNSNGFTNWERFRNRVLYVLDPNATFFLNPLN